MSLHRNLTELCQTDRNCEAIQIMSLDKLPESVLLQKGRHSQINHSVPAKYKGMQSVWDKFSKTPVSPSHGVPDPLV